MESVNILGVRVDNINKVQAIDLVEDWLKGKGKHYIVTPNPEFIMAAQKDLEFRKVLNNSDLAIPDGSRLGWAAKILQEKNIFRKFLIFPFFLFPTKVVIQFNTVGGTDLMEALCKEASDKGYTTGFLGGQNGVAAKAADCLQKKYPKLKVTFSSSGGNINDQGKNVILSETKDLDSSPSSQNDSMVSFKIPHTDILFVAFGQVKQEKWIAKNLDKIPVKVAMGVGGAFDYLSGSVTRAPSWIRKLGLEWLFRLILQPWRIKRQLKLIKFVLLVSS